MVVLKPRTKRSTMAFQPRAYRNAVTFVPPSFSNSSIPAFWFGRLFSFRAHRHDVATRPQLKPEKSIGVSEISLIEALLNVGL